MLSVLSSIGPSVARAAAVVPASLLIFFVGMLWLFGLACGKERRDYVTTISGQAMSAASALIHGNLEQHQRGHVGPSFATPEELRR